MNPHSNEIPDRATIGSPQSMPDSGPDSRPDVVSLPELLLRVNRLRWSGRMELCNGHNEKSFEFLHGAPVMAESNLATDSLGRRLVEERHIKRPDLARLERCTQQKGCNEVSALLILKLVSPKDLVGLLKAQTKRLIHEAFDWPSGQIKMTPESTQDDGVAAFRIDTIRTVQQGIEARWGADRILQDLAPLLAHYPVPRPSLKSVARQLDTDEACEALLANLTGRHPFEQALAPAIQSPRALAAAWVLNASGALNYQAEPPSDVTDATSFDAEIEINVLGGAGAPPKLGASMGSGEKAGTAEATGKESARAIEIRGEIEKRCVSLSDLDHYEMLGIDTDATGGLVKKAYFKAAKRYHPDSLMKLGLGDLKEPAAEVFAHIAAAFEVLSDDHKRKEYDATQRGDRPDIDVNLLAQAEGLFRKGEILVRMGDFQGALEFLEPAAELWPEECAYQMELGWALFKKSPCDLERARHHLELATQWGPESALSHYRLSLVLRESGETRAAKQLLDQARQLDPNVS